LKRGRKIKVLQPTEKDISWFVKNVGPNIYYTDYAVKGEGWQFYIESRYVCHNNGRSVIIRGPGWYLEVEDEKLLLFYLLQK
jgi:hypothetical protein